VAVAEYATIRWIDPVLSEAIPFILLLAVMTWRPWGIFGTPEDIQRV
jgi:branched-chain amino acid transport system permease protein